jgi:hypothetical protein
MANLLSTLSGAEVPEDSSGEQSHAEKWGRIGKVTSRGGFIMTIGLSGENRLFGQSNATRTYDQ